MDRPSATVVCTAVVGFGDVDEAASLVSSSSAASMLLISMRPRLCRFATVGKTSSIVIEYRLLVTNLATQLHVGFVSTLMSRLSNSPASRPLPSLRVKKSRSSNSSIRF